MKYKVIIDDGTVIEGEIDGNFIKVTMESDEGYVSEHGTIKKKVGKTAKKS